MKCWKLRVKSRNLKLVEAVALLTDSKRKAKKVIDEGLVSVNYKKNLSYRNLLKRGDIVWVPDFSYLFKNIEIPIIYEDKEIMVVNKPPFINSNENCPNVEGILRKRLKSNNLFVVHRLDKQTTGCLIVAKDRKIFEKMKVKFKKREIGKFYKTLVLGRTKQKEILSFPIKGQKAETIYHLEKNFGNSSLLSVEIKTGRKHQIRIHLSRTYHPVVGEFLYWKNWKEPLVYSPRILLHAFKIKINETEIVAPLDESFENFLEKLEKETIKPTELEV